MTAKKTLIIRLPNFIGDVILALPSLAYLQQAGFTLQLLGKGWAAALLAGQGLAVTPLSKGLRAQAQQLRQLKHNALQAGSAVSGLVMVRSFSGALAMRLAGIRVVGYACDGRSLLLGTAVLEDRSLHYRDYYAKLAGVCVQRYADGMAKVMGVANLPALPKPQLQVSAAAETKAQTLLQGAGITKPYWLICPFASTPVKLWPHFLDLAQRLAAQHSVIVWPGPGEDASAYAQIAQIHVLPNVKIDAYAALIAGAQGVVSNDTGPAHMAAALGVPVWVIFSAQFPADTFTPLGENVTQLRQERGWSNLEKVWAAINEKVKDC